MKPILKWPGGKRWLAERVVAEIQAMPFKTYHEPFVGAGAVALALDGSPRMVLSDFCEPLVNLWKMAKKHPDVLASECRKVFATFGNNQAGYTKARDKFNQGQKVGVTSAALMIYLNKVCFNGLWRENSKGHMNVPFGDMKTPRIPSLEELTELSKKLANTEIFRASYQDSIPRLQKGDVGFIDPPYDAGYAGYVASGFTEEDQRNLAGLLHEAAKRGTNLWITNSDTKLIREIYEWGVIEEIQEERAIAAKGTSRGRAKCLLIRSRGESE